MKPLTFQSIFNAQKCLTSCAQNARTFYWITKCLSAYKTNVKPQSILSSTNCNIIRSRMKWSLRDALRIYCTQRVFKAELMEPPSSLLITWNNSVMSVNALQQEAETIFTNQSVLKNFQEHRYSLLWQELTSGFTYGNAVEDNTLSNFISMLKTHFNVSDDEAEETEDVDMFTNEPVTKRKMSRKRKRAVGKHDWEETKQEQDDIKKKRETNATARAQRLKDRAGKKEQQAMNQHEAGTKPKTKAQGEKLKGFDGQEPTEVACSIPETVTLVPSLICASQDLAHVLNEKMNLFTGKRMYDSNRKVFNHLIEQMCGALGTALLEGLEDGKMWNDETMISVFNIIDQFNRTSEEQPHYITIYPDTAKNASNKRKIKEFLNHLEENSNAGFICPIHVESKYMTDTQAPKVSKAEDHWILCEVKAIVGTSCTLKDIEFNVYDSLASVILKRNILTIPRIQQIIELLGIQGEEDQIPQAQFKISRPQQTKTNDCGPVCTYALR